MAINTITRATKKLGEDLRVARLRRRWSQKDLALKAGVSIGTVQRTEAGNPGIAIGTIVMFFHLFGCQSQLERALDPSKDELGLAADFFHLPKRIRSARHASPEKCYTLDASGLPEDVVSF